MPKLPKYDAKALQAAMAASGASLDLKRMNNKWYAAAGGGGARQQTKPSTFASDLTSIKNAIGRINKYLDDVFKFPDSNTKKQASVTSIKDSLRHAKICQRLALLVEANQCDLPDDV